MTQLGLKMRKSAVWRLKVPGGLLGVAFLLVIVVGCGVTSADETPGPGGYTVRDVSWKVASRVGERTLILTVNVPDCAYQPKPKINSVHKIEHRHVAILTVSVEFPPKRGGCAGVELGLYRRVKLHAKLEQSRVYDGSTSPPTLRLVSE
jgi:hypothetical protein